jgi:hypothetical protein
MPILVPADEPEAILHRELSRAGGFTLGRITQEEYCMIEHSLDKAHSILYLRLTSALEEGDFAQLAKTADPYIRETGGLAGVIIEAPTFPGWASLGAMVAHFRFVRDHHKNIKKLGLVTDSAVGNVAELLASHFVSAEIRHFPAKELEAAKRWVMNQPSA